MTQLEGAAFNAPPAAGEPLVRQSGPGCEPWSVPSCSMRKYEPLAAHLRELPAGQPTVTMTFAQIASIVGGLPSSAFKARNWWANNSRVQARAWRSADWHVEPDHLDLDHQSVRFARGRVGGTYARRLGLE